MLISETYLVVRYAETDQMGIVHHSNYPVWFEAGRTDFTKIMGMPYYSIEEEGLLLPLLELNCKYKSPARYGDEVVVRTSIKEITYTRIVFRYDVCKAGDEEILASGETMHVWTDKDLKPVNIKKRAPHVYELLQKCME